MRTVFLSLILLTSSGLSARSKNDGLQTKLDASVTQYRLAANGLADALAQASDKFQIPMGIEWLKDPQALHALNRTWKGVTVRQVLTSIVDTYPGYSLQVAGDVVHVFRRDLLNDRQNFLNIKVPDFLEVREEPAGLANVQLRSVIQNIVSPRELPPDSGEGGSYTSGSVPEKLLTLRLHGLTVREALEKLTAVSERNIWVVTFSDGSALTPTGFRRTETLWHPVPFSNRQQPMWDFLSWAELAQILGRVDLAGSDR
jgi:hypothetical protein